MELYRKKINIINKQNKRERERNSRFNNNPQKNIYLQKAIKKNMSKPKNESMDLSSTGDIHNIRSSMEEIFSNDESKTKAIKYVIDLGKMKNARNNSNKRGGGRNKKSASPHLHAGGTIISGNVESVRDTPNRTYYDGKWYNINNNTAYNFYPNQNNYNNNAYKNNSNIMQNQSQNQINNSNDIDDEEFYENQQNYNNFNPEESQNEYDFSSLNNLEERNIEIIKYSRSPEPRMINKVEKELTERYYKAARQQPRQQQRQQRERREKPEQREQRDQQKYSSRHNKDINIMPIRKKQIITHKYYKSNDINPINPNLEKDMNDLLNTIDEMQSVINGQKNEIKNNRKDLSRKNKEINFLKNELNNVQKELDEKIMEQDKEIGDINIFNSNNIEQLKNEYFKLLQDYETNINDYNNLKDDYNKIVDEYNSLKT